MSLADHVATKRIRKPGIEPSERFFSPKSEETPLITGDRREGTQSLDVDSDRKPSLDADYPDRSRILSGSIDHLPSPLLPATYHKSLEHLRSYFGRLPRSPLYISHAVPSSSPERLPTSILTVSDLKAIITRAMLAHLHHPICTI